MTRRYDLDWLRVILFGILVVHHAAVGFAPFGAEIYGFANDRLAGDGLSLAIYFSHTWRLPALFLIAGIGMYFATSRGFGARFIGRRVLNLVLPAMFATFVLNLFAGHAIAWANDPTARFADTLTDWWLSPEPRQVMHVWFLVNLTIYTILCWPLFALRARLERLDLSPPLMVAALVGIVTLIAVAFKPYASAIAGDGYQFPWYLGIFASGFLIGAQHGAVLAWLARWWWALLVAGLVGFAIDVGILVTYLASNTALGIALSEGGWAAAGLAPAYGAVPVISATVKGVNAWCLSLTALGMAARYLNRPGRALTTLGRATFPIYVLHFPITLITLAVLAQVPWPWGWELLLLIAAVYGLTGGIYVLADRSSFPAILIGGRARSAGPVP
ncbi:acyltransferase family protein [Actibacterium sp. 188UL27-1]|uniref:acyltransferase family protein n=1 Tax=Actibacterium sp. 188UL27-1 TaxID=2786961 RepID=UPI001956FE16|nr:acyltransferase family protein [Actibacterium sp. 188UL27-1]MBM7067941.1 acyltransferase family protein [Actibacterium sp. 188UL27-1]